MGDDPKSILITGASSGIGEALALLYAQPGTNLFLSGRNRERLMSVAEQCRDRGAEVHPKLLDVREIEQMNNWMREADATVPLNLVIANAAISAHQTRSDDFEEQGREIIDVNVNGISNTVFPALGVMRARKSGQIAIVSSAAAFYGLSSTPAYSASKAANKALGEGLRARYGQEGVDVCVICPGKVFTPMGEKNDYNVPFGYTAEKAAKVIKRGLARNKARITFPIPVALAVWLLTTMPASLANRLTQNLPRKE